MDYNILCLSCMCVISIPSGFVIHFLFVLFKLFIHCKVALNGLISWNCIFFLCVLFTILFFLEFKFVHVGFVSCFVFVGVKATPLCFNFPVWLC